MINSSWNHSDLTSRLDTFPSPKPPHVYLVHLLSIWVSEINIDHAVCAHGPGLTPLQGLLSSRRGPYCICTADGTQAQSHGDLAVTDSDTDATLRFFVECKSFYILTGSIIDLLSQPHSAIRAAALIRPLHSGCGQIVSMLVSDLLQYVLQPWGGFLTAIEWTRSVCRVNGLYLIRGGTVVVFMRCALWFQRVLFFACLESSGRRQMPKQIWWHREKWKGAFVVVHKYFILLFSWTFSSITLSIWFAEAGPSLPLSCLRLRPQCSCDLIRASFVPLASSCSCFRGSSNVSRDPRRHGHGTQNLPTAACAICSWFIGFCLVVAQTGRAGIAL